MPLEVKVDGSEFAELAANFDNADQVVMKELRIATRKSMAVLETNTVGLTPIGATKLLSQSWATETKTFGAGVRGELFSPLNYSGAVEHGRRPGKQPPIDPIHQWVVRKGIAPPDEARGVAYTIARAIGKRGTKGAKMLQKAWRKSKPTIERIYNDVPRRLIEALSR